MFPVLTVVCARLLLLVKQARKQFSPEVQKWVANKKTLYPQLSVGFTFSLLSFSILFLSETVQQIIIHQAALLPIADLFHIGNTMNSKEGTAVTDKC